MSDVMIRLPEARLSYPSLFKARQYENGPPRYGASFIFDPETDLSAIKAAIKAAANEKFGSKLAGLVKAGKFRNPLRDCSEMVDEDGAAREGYDQEGAKFLRANATQENPPQVVDRAKRVISDPRGIYAGCYVYAVVKAFAYDTKGNRGVSFGLRVVQFSRDGDAFGGGSGLDMLEELPDSGGDAAAPSAGEGDPLFD